LFISIYGDLKITTMLSIKNNGK